MTSILVVADDLTGAADTAAAFVAPGRSVAVSLAGALPPCDAVAVDTDTRRTSADEAVTAVRRAVERGRDRGASVFYKKVDSTLRGNLAAELAAFVATAPPGLCVFAPAFPATGRTTRDGVQYVHGVPLDRTEMWRLARRPAPPDVDLVVREAGLETASIRLAQVRAGAGTVRDELAAARDAGAQVVICDAENDADLGTIARAATVLDGPVLWAGSAGLARALQAELPGGGADSGAVAGGVAAGAVPPGRILAVVGSASEQARAQAARLVEAGLTRVWVPALALVEDDADALARSGGSLQAAIAAADVVVTIAGGEVIGERGAARAAVAALARLVSPSLAAAGALVVTGGETARAVLRAAGVDWFAVHGETEPGVVHGLAVAGDSDSGQRRWRLVTKAGAFGDEFALSKAVPMLRDAAASDARGDEAAAQQAAEGSRT